MVYQVLLVNLANNIYAPDSHLSINPIIILGQPRTPCGCTCVTPQKSHTHTQSDTCWNDRTIDLIIAKQ